MKQKLSGALVPARKVLYIQTYSFRSMLLKFSIVSEDLFFKQHYCFSHVSLNRDNILTFYHLSFVLALKKVMAHSRSVTLNFEFFAEWMPNPVNTAYLL